MSLVVCQEGQRILLDIIVQYGGYWIVRLYKNDYTPQLNSTLGAFVEADFKGYSAKQIQNWTQAATDPSGDTFSIADTVTFNYNANQGGSASNTVYGYYVVDLGGGPAKLLWAERFATPKVMDSNDDFIQITPKLTLGNKP